MNGGKAPAADAAGVNVAAMVDPAVLGAMALGIGNEVIGVAAGMRYPPHIVDMAKLNKAELASLEQLLSVWLKDQNVKMDPGTAFLLLGAITLGMHFLTCEMAFKAYKTEATMTPPPAPSKPAPAPAVRSSDELRDGAGV